MKTSSFLRSLEEMRLSRPFPEIPPVAFSPDPARGPARLPHHTSPPGLSTSVLVAQFPSPLSAWQEEGSSKSGFQAGQAAVTSHWGQSQPSLCVLIGINLFIISVVLWRKTRKIISSLSNRRAEPLSALWLHRLRLQGSFRCVASRALV